MRQSYWRAGARLSVLRGAADTAGRYALVEGWFPAGARLPPHAHRRYAERIHVLGGELTVWAGGRRAVLRRGDAIVIPAGTAHAVAATGAGPAHAWLVAAPSGLARLVAAAGPPAGGGEAAPPAAADPGRLRRAWAEPGDEALGPPGAPADGLAAARGER